MKNPKVRLIGDPILRKLVDRVSKENFEKVKELVPVMFKIMREQNGIGLAANQIGEGLSIFVLSIDGLDEVYINPEISSAEDEIFFEEGCLSIPGVSAQTKRFSKVTVRYTSHLDQDLSTRHEQTVQGIKAIAIQHEMDHLSGKLYVDQLSQLKKAIVLKKHKKFLKQNERQ
jgi:peptide deformylase